MKKDLVRPSLFALLLILLSAGLTFTEGLTASGTGLAAGENGRYIRMADNFFIMYDPSTTMAVPYKETGLTRIEAAKKIMRESNASLPELGWQAVAAGAWGAPLPTAPADNKGASPPASEEEKA